MPGGTERDRNKAVVCGQKRSSRAVEQLLTCRYTDEKLESESNDPGCGGLWSGGDIREGRQVHVDRKRTQGREQAEDKNEAGLPGCC